MTTSVEKSYAESVGTANDYLGRPEELGAFAFAVADDEGLDATVGVNDESDIGVDLDALVGILLLLLARSHDMHPAVLGHGATAFAINHWED